jgi:putative intracellular protease/amidase
MTKTVHLAVYDTLADWEVGYAVANINTPVWHDGGYQVVTVTETADPVTTMGGMCIAPAMTLNDLRAQDSELLILPGAMTWDTGGNRRFAGAARSFLDAGVPVAAICGATYGLADEGLLDGREHTSSALEYLETASNYRGRDEYRDEPAVTDRDLITAGPANPVDFARHVFARLGLMTHDVLEAWYSLYRSGDARFYEKLVAARHAETPA